jgi:hypothetical protein
VWRSRKTEADLDDVLELLRGIGRTLMVISANVETIVRLLEGDDDGEADA